MDTKIVVKQSLKGKFGPQIKDKDGFLSFSKRYEGVTVFDPGTVLMVDLYTSDTGKRYINKVLGTEAVEATPTPKAVEEKPNVSSGMRDFDKEARGKTVCQYVSALLSNPSVNTADIDGVFDTAFKLMEKTFSL